MFQFQPLSGRIHKLLQKREWANHGNMRLNAERTKIYTDYYRSHEAEYPVLKRAGCILDWCRKCSTPIEDEDLFVGSLGPGFRPINFYVEWVSDWLAACVNDTDERFRAAWQAPGAVTMTDEERLWLREAAAFWKNHNIPAHMAGIVPEEVYTLSNNGVNNTSPKDSSLPMSSKPQGHYIANFDKAVNTGFDAVKQDAIMKLESMKGRTFGKDARSHAFYRAAVRVCEGAMVLSERYAQACRLKAVKATGARKDELLKWRTALIGS
jgi:formate C-acetyltransferase